MKSTTASVCQTLIAITIWPLPAAFEKDKRMDKLILDACCGGRAFWFDKNNPLTLFVDRRTMQPEAVGNGINSRIRKCLPDEESDFRKMSYSSESFKLVVFDPPHLFCGEKSFMNKCYGSLDKNTWKNDLKQGFSECFRVLKDDGILIFKWNESEIPLKNILRLAKYKPLFGHPSGRAQKTHWVTFMKNPASCRDIKEVVVEN